MVGVGFLEVLDAKVIYAECEGCFAGRISPESGGLGHGIVAKTFEFLDELVKRDDACLF